MAITDISRTNEPEPREPDGASGAKVVEVPTEAKLSLSEAFEKLLNQSNLFARGAFFAAREAVRQARVATEAVPALRQMAIDKEGDARLLALKESPFGRKKFSFGTGLALAFALALFDVLPANMSAQAMGFDNTLTIAITVLFTVLLAAIMFAAGEARPGRQRHVAIAFIVGILVFIGALRWSYASTVTADPVAALIEAAGLMLATLVLLVAGIVVLAFTKSRRVSDAEAEAAAARHAAEAKQAEAEEFAERAKTEESAFISLTLACSTTYFLDDEEQRERFIAYVRRELHR